MPPKRASRDSRLLGTAVPDDLGGIMLLP
jgi:hypothetical protein